MKVSVLVPTYHRPKDLKRCLDALSRQSVAPDEIIVVARENDTETWQVLDAWLGKLPLRTVKVDIPGQVSALNAGLKHANTDIIAITDDDAAPRPEWVSRIKKHFSDDPRVGGVGGRDWVHQYGKIENGSRTLVGKVSWYGRVIGNHHLGVGEARSVDVLKGANMSYRRSAIEGIWFNEQLKGSGAQVHNDLCFSLEVRRKGWRLIYDPQVEIDHYPAERFDEDRRDQINLSAISNAAHNETIALLGYFQPLQRTLYLLWAFTIGTGVTPGMLQAIRLRLQGKKESYPLLKAVQKGRRTGRREWRNRHHKSPSHEEQQ